MTRPLVSPKRCVNLSSKMRADLSSPVRRQESRRFSLIVHDSGVSEEKSSDNGHGSEEVGELEIIGGAFCESWSAVAGGIEDGGERRFACAIVKLVLLRSLEKRKVFEKARRGVVDCGAWGHLECTLKVRSEIWSELLSAKLKIHAGGQLVHVNMHLPGAGPGIWVERGLP